MRTDIENIKVAAWVMLAIETPKEDTLLSYLYMIEGVLYGFSGAVTHSSSRCVGLPDGAYKLVNNKLTRSNDRKGFASSIIANIHTIIDDAIPVDLVIDLLLTPTDLVEVVGVAEKMTIHLLPKNIWALRDHITNATGGITERVRVSGIVPDKVCVVTGLYGQAVISAVNILPPKGVN